MPSKLFFPRNELQKKTTRFTKERVTWVEQRNFEVFTRYPLREPHHPPSSSEHP